MLQLISTPKSYLDKRYKIKIVGTVAVIATPDRNKEKTFN